ncbi:twin-arginine translocation pathway signal [Gaeumannomyces tritici R3-111a-1]|uniref:Twin-arginine translocation pathway signal n=1 Tax=Gaeumannomyces tritici (strain R3-111a-1) TaxID=644352 RepID=J3NHR8_GAET3|nr:twin-arginine translocation pathway signal [Gaeumannomyces tritici R3-111a-1]EJT80811.1 twin-arginine translocation pathway signal [Gaeumannomyces tritici R3-111a-1]
MASTPRTTAPPRQAPLWGMPDNTCTTTDVGDAAAAAAALPPVGEYAIEADGVRVFYRHSGPTDPGSPTVLLLHGYSSSSYMYRGLMPYLAASGYRVVAPDLPGSGFTEVPRARRYAYTFASLASTLEAFVDALGLGRFAMYVFDHGAPVGFRLALRRPDAVTAIVSQNGNVCAEGLRMPFWEPIEAYWATASSSSSSSHRQNRAEQCRQAISGALELPTTRWCRSWGLPADVSAEHEAALAEACRLDQALLDRPGAKEAQLDLFYDYRTNLELYPRFQQYLYASRVPVLAVWGRNDPIFAPEGALALGRHVEEFEMHWLDAGHFALDGNEAQVAGLMRSFFDTYYVFSPF